MKSKAAILTLFLFIVLCVDLSITFVQFHQQPLGGDLSAIVLPSPHYTEVLENPLGLKAILENKKYAGPNRFFAHYFESNYFKKAPLFLQNFTTPIKSVYLASTLLKFGLHIGFILFILLAIPPLGLQKKLISAIIISALLQVNGFSKYIGLIESAPTYAIFYGLSTLWAALLVLYYFRCFRQAKSIHWFHYLLFVTLGIITTLMGPLNAPSFLIISAILIGHHLLNNKGINWIGNKHQLLPLIIISALSLYSFCLGTFNIENAGSISLIERYQLMPQGLLNLVFNKLAWPLLIALLSINYIILKRSNYKNKSTILKLYSFIALFSVLYIILLPMGGYRSYRPFIIRRDVMVPITLFCFYLLTYSTMSILKESPFSKIYISVLIVSLTIFFTVDTMELGRNNCEQEVLKKLSMYEGNGTVLPIHDDCLLMSWEKINKPIDSYYNVQMINDWNITSQRTLYYNVK